MCLGMGLDTRLPWPRDRLLYAYGVTAFLGWNTLAITSFGLKESHVHDVLITKEAPNYRTEI
jgi:hypothetical protein